MGVLESKTNNLEGRRKERRKTKVRLKQGMNGRINEKGDRPYICRIMKVERNVETKEKKETEEERKNQGSKNQGSRTNEETLSRTLKEKEKENEDLKNKKYSALI